MQWTLHREFVAGDKNNIALSGLWFLFVLLLSPGCTRCYKQESPSGLKASFLN
jgi:hypothetical protein